MEKCLVPPCSVPVLVTVLNLALTYLAMFSSIISNVSKFSSYIPSHVM